MAPNPRQFHKLTDYEIRKLKDAGHEPHDLKPRKGASRYDLFKDEQGNVYVCLKAGCTSMDGDLGINLNSLQGNC